MSGRAPALLGVSHLGLTVRDLNAATAFWTEVMGFELAFGIDTFCMLLDPRTKLAIGVNTQGGEPVEPFDRHRVGLDHLALAVRDTAALTAWQQHLRSRGVPHSGLAESDTGTHLNLRGPDDFPIELFALTDEAAVTWGFAPGADRVASGHRCAFA